MNLGEFAKQHKKTLRGNEMAISKKKMEEIRNRSRKGNKKPYTVVPSGIRSYDKAMGGLILGGHIHFWSKEGLGKTNVCAHLAKTFQESSDKPVYWADTEGNLNPDWISRIGVDIDNIVWCEDTYAGEEHMENLIVHLMDNDVSLCILDSVDNMVPLKQLDAVADDVRASNAHLLARTMPEINTFRRGLQSKGEMPPTFVWISQARDDQRTGGFRYSGGHILSHTWTQSTRITRIDYRGEDFKSLPKDRRSEAKYYYSECVGERNRLDKNGVVFTVIFDIEEARFRNDIMLIEEKSKYIKAGAWYQVGDLKFNGMKKLINAIEEDSSILDTIESLGE